MKIRRVGTIKIGVSTTKIYQWDLYEKLIEFSSNPECIDVELTEFLMWSGETTPIDDYDVFLHLRRLVDQAISSDDYNIGCALRVYLRTLTIDIPSEQIEVHVLGLLDEHDVIFEFDHHQIEEAAPSQLEEGFQVSLNETIEEDVPGLEDDEQDIIFEFDNHIEEAAPSQLVEVYRVLLSETIEEERQLGLSLEKFFVSLNETIEEDVLGLEDEPDVVFVYEEAAPSQLEQVARVDDFVHLLDVHNVSFDFDHQTEEAAPSQLGQVFQALFNEANIVRLRPASKLAVESLKRKIYKKTSDVVGEIDMCSICLEEFDDGRSIATLPCGDEFDEECVMNWFMSSHVCPLCRYEMPLCH
ncbi:PREDICTED: uncharacterized protein LOC109132836 [Camelina sativa]|uniref:RING-type E3 ubiquitin transferase n=1 Tax=Camelina sativa TaxID=90675 RepID=A0ABM1RP70_CAMSA|nr:PREDICTED: uncharacterized protein LOC109132836 [Camelina sativa]